MIIKLGDIPGMIAEEDKMLEIFISSEVELSVELCGDCEGLGTFYNTPDDQGACLKCHGGFILKAKG